MYHCKHCNHIWKAKVEEPKSCPRCKRYGDLEKVEEAPASE